MNRIVGVLNPQQWKLLGGLLFAGTGPLAWILSRYFGMADVDVKMWLDFAAVITSVVGGGVILNASTNAKQVEAVVVSMSPADKVKALEAQPAPALQSLAAALPDQALVRAAGDVPGVQVHAQAGVAPQAVLDVANDPTAPDVVPMVGGPVDGKTEHGEKPPPPPPDRDNVRK